MFRKRPGVVCRTARIGLRVTDGQRRRLFGLLETAGDVWAGLIDWNRALMARGAAPVVEFVALCRALTGVPLGDLSRRSAEGVMRRYSDAWFETNKRRRKGERAFYPRRKRHLFPVRFRFGDFHLDARRVRVVTARGTPPLSVRLARDIPYPSEDVRAVTLVAEDGRLFLDVTAEVAVADHGLDPGRVAGIDVGIIHPFAVVADDEALLVSGRQLRAEERLHLEDQKQRIRKLSSKKGFRRGEKGSRRYKKIRSALRGAETRHRRRIRQAHHEAAKRVVYFAVQSRIGTLVVGDPKGITANDAGRHHNLRLRQWRRTHLTQALRDKAQAAGIAIVSLDERGTSSTCPNCLQPGVKPRGRSFLCSSCGFRGHRDLVGARNIAGRHIPGGITREPSLVTHRRAGTPPARRDRRRHLYDLRRGGRSCPDPGLPTGSRSPQEEPAARTADVAA